MGVCRYCSLVSASLRVVHGVLGVCRYCSLVSASLRGDQGVLDVCRYRSLVSAPPGGTSVVVLGVRRAEESAKWAGCGSGSECEAGVLGELELALYSEGLLEYRDPQASVPVLSIGYGFTNDELQALSKPPSAYAKVSPRRRRYSLHCVLAALALDLARSVLEVQNPPSYSCWWNQSKTGYLLSEKKNRLISHIISNTRIWNNSTYRCSAARKSKLWDCTVSARCHQKQCLLHGSGTQKQCLLHASGAP